jgi:hypothetical protein
MASSLPFFRVFFRLIIENPKAEILLLSPRFVFLSSPLNQSFENLKKVKK